MPVDLSAIVESLQRALGEIPPVAIALSLLAGPTAALIGYRLIGVARHLQTSPEVAAEPLWVCHECRSVNELRHSRCYHCGLERDATEEIEVIVSEPTGAPRFFEVPEGSPFAAISTNAQIGASSQATAGAGPGVPVMADPWAATDPVAVGPGQTVEPVETAPTVDVVPAAERHR